VEVSLGDETALWCANVLLGCNVQLRKPVGSIEAVEVLIGFVRTHQDITHKMFSTVAYVGFDQPVPDTASTMAKIDRQLGDVPTLRDIIRLGESTVMKSCCLVIRVSKVLAS